MKKKLLVTILTLFLLSSCISITRYPDTSQRDFVTAALAPTATRWMPTTSTIPHETATAGPVSTASAPANCANAAILLRDLTIPDHTQIQAGETFTKTWEFQRQVPVFWRDYTLKFTSGDDINAPSVTPMPAVAPNERVQVSMELTAPTTDGTYAGYFALFNSDGSAIPIGAEKTFWVKFRVGAYVAVSAASGSFPVPAGNCTFGHNVDYVSQIVSLINAERINAGLPALVVNSEITAFAQIHAEEMAYNDFLSHDSSSGAFGERMMHFNTTHPGYGALGEILAIGTPQNAMDQWRKDEHWDFVLSSNTLIGVGYAYNSCSDYGGYITVDFGD